MADGTLPLHTSGGMRCIQASCESGTAAPHPHVHIHVVNCKAARRRPKPAQRAVDGLVRVEIELVVRRLP